MTISYSLATWMYLSRCSVSKLFVLNIHWRGGQGNSQQIAFNSNKKSRNYSNDRKLMESYCPHDYMQVQGTIQSHRTTPSPPTLEGMVQVEKATFFAVCFTVTPFSTLKRCLFGFPLHVPSMLNTIVGALLHPSAATLDYNNHKTHTNTKRRKRERFHVSYFHLKRDFASS